MMREKDVIHFNYVGALYALSVGVPTDRVLVAEQEAAELNDFSAAIGIRDALKDYNNTDRNFNCKVALQHIDENSEDFDEYYEDE